MKQKVTYNGYEILAQRETYLTHWFYIKLYAIIPSKFLGIPFTRKRLLYNSRWDLEDCRGTSRAKFVSNIPNALKLMERWVKDNGDVVNIKNLIVNSKDSFLN